MEPPEEGHGHVRGRALILLLRITAAPERRARSFIHCEAVMILKRFYEESLAQASFLVGCARTGEAVVIDANRDVDQYIAAAAAEGLRITAVTETHIHADYVSGSRELAERTGARLYLSDEGDADWKYAFSGQPNVTLVRHGDTVRAGNVRLDVVRTPGHTPEHIAFLLTDGAASPQPVGVFTGDFVFVGDVGRPDLLERAAHVKGTMEQGARALFRSLQPFRNLPERLLVWPGHGSGSACGKSLGGLPVTTVGYEKLTNWGLAIDNEEQFVTEVLEGQPEPPAYFKEMKRVNKAGPPSLAGFRTVPRMSGPTLHDVLQQDVTVIDIRSMEETATGTLPGVLTVPLSRTFSTWAGSLVDYGRPLFLVAATAEAAARAVRDLALIGLDDVRGWFGPDAIREWRAGGGPLEPAEQVSALDAVERLGRREAIVLDVRGQQEYEAGHVPGARHIPLGSLPHRACELPAGPIVVHCATGARAAIAASVLRRSGATDVSTMAGGFQAYQMFGLPVATGAAPDDEVGGVHSAIAARVGGA
jgi:hydroxyacylglutathione hydrolase